MIINCLHVVKDLDGKDLEWEGKKLSLNRALAISLVNAGNTTLSGEESFKRGALAERVYNGTNIEITAEEATLMKDCLSKMFGPLVVVQVFRILDGK